MAVKVTGSACERQDLPIRSRVPGPELSSVRDSLEQMQTLGRRQGSESFHVGVQAFLMRGTLPAVVAEESEHAVSS